MGFATPGEGTVGPMKVKIIRQADNPEGSELTATLVAAMRDEGFVCTEYEYAVGTYFAPHDHAVDKCDAVVAGCLRIVVDGTPYDLHPGDRIYLPAGTLHDARVIGAHNVVSIDGQKP